MNQYMKSEFCPSDREDWRRWLQTNHATEGEVWLVYYKKDTDRASVSYRDSVEESLCFGWIDGIKKKIDDQRYTHRFTPRKAGSKWSPLNIRLARKMIAEGKMTRSGLIAFDERVKYDEKILQTTSASEIPLTPELEEALKANKQAWENFNNLAPSYKKQYIGWLVSAKKPETRARRLEEALELLAKNEKLGMK